MLVIFSFVYLIIYFLICIGKCLNYPWRRGGYHIAQVTLEMFYKDKNLQKTSLHLYWGHEQVFPDHSILHKQLQNLEFQTSTSPKDGQTRDVITSRYSQFPVSVILESLKLWFARRCGKSFPANSNLDEHPFSFTKWEQKKKICFAGTA